MPFLESLLAAGGRALALSAVLATGSARAEPARPESAPPSAPLPLSVQPAEGTAPPSVAQPAAPRKSRELPPTVFARVSEDPQPTLTPATFLDTVRMAERYKALAEAGGWSRLPEGLTLKTGDRNPAVAPLRAHLVMTGDLAADAPHSDVYDATLTAAVKAYQGRHGLPETGFLARLTVAALNVPAAERHRQLATSAERLLGSNFPFGERYVVVNVPSATVEAVEKGAVARRYVAVVGKPDKATPTLETRITDVNLNPTWTVPISVIRNEIIPAMRKDPGHLARNRIRILGPGGVEVDPTAIDWATEKAAHYTLRQDAGLDNSLGQMRIDMPNRHAVYMHDTPSKSLFAGSVRFHSHGCVRVGQVKQLAEWLLQGTEGPGGEGTSWGGIEIETSIATGERRDLKLAKAIPVAFVYLTGYATADGRAHFRGDIYGRDVPEAEVATTGTLPAKAVAKPTAPAKPAASKPNASKSNASKSIASEASEPKASEVVPAKRQAPAFAADAPPVPPASIEGR